jgi:hypothetical protein
VAPNFFYIPGPTVIIITKVIEGTPKCAHTPASHCIISLLAKMYKWIKNRDDCNSLLQCCNELFTWSDNWLMKLNISKCKILSICYNRNNLIKFNYSLDLPDQGLVTLEHVESIKDLGVLMDSNLSFDDHIYDKINMGNKMLVIIRKNH